MTKFNYRISNSKGKLQKGSLDATTREDAIRKLSEKDGVIVLMVKAQWKFLEWLKMQGTLNTKMLSQVTKRMADLFEQEFTISDSLRMLELQMSHSFSKRLIARIRQRVDQGASLADSLGDFESTFTKFYTSLIRVGEKTSNLTGVLRQLDKQISETYRIKKSMVMAAAYPVIILCLTLVVAGGMMFFIFPIIRDVIGSLNSELPITTVIMFAMQDFLTAYWPYLLIGIALSLASIYILWKQAFFQHILINLLIRTPLLKSVYVPIQQAQIMRTLSTLLESGVSLGESLPILRDSVSLAPYRKAVGRVLDKVTNGAPLSNSLEEENRLFPDAVYETVRLSEKSGDLARSVTYLADFYEEETHDTLKVLTTLVQPLMLVFVGVIVGTFVISIMAPLLSMTSNIGF
jgi:type II secretory pathway component PulF